MRVQHLFALALVSLLAAGCALGRAETEPKRIAVLQFKGSKASNLQRAIADLVGKHHDVVSHKKYRKAARRLRARSIRARNVARVAAKLGVDAVVDGQLVRRGKRRYTLRLQVREGATGQTIEEYTIPVRRRELSDSNRRTLERKLDDLFAEIDPIDRYQDDDDDYDDRRRARRSSRSKAKRRSRNAANRKAQRDERRRERLRAERAERRRAERDAERRAERRAERDAERRAERRASRKARRDRQRRRARRARPMDPIDAELEEAPVVLNDQVDEDGQFIDDEVPAALK